MTKQYLRDFRRQAREMSQLRQSLDNYRYLIGPGIANYSGASVSGGSQTSVVERTAEKLIELEDRYIRMLALYQVTRERIEDAIEKLSTEERSVIRAYYLDGLTWEETAYLINYSYPQVHRIHAAALIKLLDEDETEARRES